MSQLFYYTNKNIQKLLQIPHF